MVGNNDQNMIPAAKYLTENTSHLNNIKDIVENNMKRGAWKEWKLCMTANNIRHTKAQSQFNSFIEAVFKLWNMHLNMAS